MQPETTFPLECGVLHKGNMLSVQVWICDGGCSLMLIIGQARDSGTGTKKKVCGQKGGPAEKEAAFWDEG